MTSKTIEKLVRHIKKKNSKKISGGNPQLIPKNPMPPPPPQQIQQQQQIPIKTPLPPQQIQQPIQSQQIQPQIPIKTPQQIHIKTPIYQPPQQIQQPIKSPMPPPPPQPIQQPISQQIPQPIPQQYQQPIQQQYQQPIQQQIPQQFQQQIQRPIQQFQQQIPQQIPQQYIQPQIPEKTLENKEEVFMGLDDNEILIVVVFISVLVVVYSAVNYMFDNIPVLFDNILDAGLFYSVFAIIPIYIMVVQNSYMKLGFFHKLNWILIILFITTPIALNIFITDLDSMFPDLFTLPDFFKEFRDIMYNLFIIVYIISAIIGTFVLPKIICENPKSGSFCIIYKLYDSFGLE